MILTKCGFIKLVQNSSWLRHAKSPYQTAVVATMTRSHHHPPKLHVSSLDTKKKSKKSIDHGSSVKAELIRYIQVTGDEEEVGCLDVRERHQKAFPRLCLVAMRVLAVPATSAPVERVFSHGGIIMFWCRCVGHLVAGF